MTYQVLFASPRNAARSIMAEALLNALGGGRFRAFSAGARPAERADALALHVLQYAGYPIEGLRPRGFGALTANKDLRFDFLITVCTPGEALECPELPGRPVAATWMLANPALRKGDYDEQRLAYAQALAVLRRRVQQFTSLPFDSVDRIALGGSVRSIGEDSNRI